MDTQLYLQSNKKLLYHLRRPIALHTPSFDRSPASWRKPMSPVAIIRASGLFLAFSFKFSQSTTFALVQKQWRNVFFICNIWLLDEIGFQVQWLRQTNSGQKGRFMVGNKVTSKTNRQIPIPEADSSKTNYNGHKCRQADRDPENSLQVLHKTTDCLV